MLRFNGLSPVGANPFSAMCTSQVGFTSAAVGTTANLTTQWGRGERFGVQLAMGELASNPPATENPVAWTMAGKGGDLAAENTINESNSTVLTSLSLGKDLSCDLIQDASITAAALSMITSLATNMVNANTLTGPMQMTMNLAADMVQDGQVDAAMGLIAWMQASLTQDADMSASNLRGTLSMEASIVSYGELTPEGLRDAVWSAVLANYPVTGTAGNTLALAGSGGVDYTALANAVWTRASRTLSTGGNEDVAAAVAAYAIESGWSTETLLRVFAAVLAGKVSGAGTGTETFRGINDDKDRVIATVDTDGNRTAITLDGT